MLIETYNLTKKYGKKLALNKVNLKIDREPKAIPGGSKNKAKHRELKKIAHKLRKDFIPRDNASFWTLKIFIKEFALVIISSRL